MYHARLDEPTIKRRKMIYQKRVRNACVDGRFHLAFLYYIYANIFFFSIKDHTFAERKGCLFVKFPESCRFLENGGDGKASNVHMG